MGKVLTVFNKDGKMIYINCLKCKNEDTLAFNGFAIVCGKCGKPLNVTKAVKAEYKVIEPETTEIVEKEEEIPEKVENTENP